MLDTEGDQPQGGAVQRFGDRRSKQSVFLGRRKLKHAGGPRWSQRARPTHHSGNVLFLSRPMRFLLMVVEQGTASRWWELLGRVGTHWLFLLAFCSLGDMEIPPLSLRAETAH